MDFHFCDYGFDTASAISRQSEARLTNNPGNSGLLNNSNARRIAASGNNVHITWYEDRDSDYEIYYKRSTDGGVNWGNDTRLTNHPSFSLYPSIAVSGSTLHLVWQDSRDGNEEIYYLRSTNSGSNWEASTRLTNSSGQSKYPSVSVSGNSVHVFWHDFRSGSWKIYYKRSSDGGVTWTADARLSDNGAPGGAEGYPCTCANGSYVHAAWHDSRDGYFEIYYKRSIDGGNNWSADVRLTNDPQGSDVPSISASGNHVHVTWYDQRDGNSEIYYKRSSDNGANWSSDIRLTNAADNSFFPVIESSENNVHVVWHDRRSSIWRPYYKRSSDYGNNWESEIILNNEAINADHPFIALSGTMVHVIWEDYRFSDAEIFYRRNPTGNTIGITSLSSEIPSSFELYQNYPNPFNPATQIKFDIQKAGNVKIAIYDMLGREVELLVNGMMEAGSYNADWNATGFASGVYFYKIEAGDFSAVRKMILIK